MDNGGLPMFKMQCQIKNQAGLDQFLQEAEVRVTKFMRGFLIRLSEDYQKQLQGRYKAIREEEAQLISENLESVFLDFKKEPRPEKTRRRRETTMQAEHYAGVVTHAIKKSSKDIDQTRNLIKVLPNKRNLQQSSASVFVLVRYGPWTLKTLPYIPDAKEATIIFMKVEPEQVIKVGKKNKKESKKVRSLLLQNGVKYAHRAEVMKDLHGFNDLEYWTLKKEFGIDARKVSVWRPALRYITKEGYKKIMKKHIELYRTLFDPTFKSYQNIDKGYKIVDESIGDQLINFQDRIRG